MNWRAAIKNLVLLITLLASCKAFAASAEITVVYWSSKDCRWCSWWETSSGQLARFNESDEFKKLAFYGVKTERLEDKYGAEHFPKEIVWVWDQLRVGTIKAPERPEWHVFLGHRRLAAFYGAKDWETKAFPFIKTLVTKSADERQALLEN